MTTNTKRERIALPRWTAYGLVLLQGLIYGFGDPISKHAFDSVPVFSLLTARYAIALAVIFLFAGCRILRGLKTCNIKELLLPSLCISLAYVVGNFAIDLTAATAVAFIRSLSIVLAPMLALVVFREKYSWKHIPVQALVVLGLYLLCGLGGLSGFGWGEVLALLTALFIAGSLVFGEKALEHTDSVTLTAVQTATSAVMALLFALLFEGGVHLEAADLPIWGIIAYLGICCTIFGYLLQNAALTSISSRTVALLQCFCPVMTALFSLVVLGERLTPAGMVGAAVILICVAAETNMQDK